MQMTRVVFPTGRSDQIIGMRRSLIFTMMVFAGLMTVGAAVPGSTAPHVDQQEPQRESADSEESVPNATDSESEPGSHQRRGRNKNENKKDNPNQEKDVLDERYFNGYFTAASDLVGKSPTGTVCKKSCARPFSTSRTIRTNFALGECVCDKVSPSGDTIDRRAALASVASGFVEVVESVAGLSDATWYDIFSDVIASDQIVGYFVTEVVTLWLAGHFAPSIAALATFAVVLFSVPLGAQIMSLSFLYSLIIRFSFLFMGAKIGHDGRYLFGVSCAMVVSCVFGLLVTSYLTLILCVMILVSSTFGGIAAVVNRGISDKGESRAVSFLLVVRFFQVTTETLWTSIVQLTKTAGDNEMLLWILTVSLLIYSFAGGRRRSWWAFAESVTEAQLLVTCIPGSVLAAFTRQGTFDPDALFGGCVAVTCAFKLFGYALIRWIGSAATPAAPVDRKDLKKYAGDPTFVSCYYVRYALNLCATLFVIPTGDLGFIQSSVMMVANTHFTFGFIDVMIFTMISSWTFDAILALVYPALASSPIFPTKGTKAQQAKALIKGLKDITKEVGMISASELIKTVGLTGINEATPSEWEFQKEVEASKIVTGSDSLVSPEDIHDMNFATAAIRTKIGKGHCVHSAPDEIRTMSHVFGDFDVMHDHPPNFFEVHIDGSSHVPSCVQYYNDDSHVNEAILILKFPPGTLRSRSRYVQLAEPKDAICVLMFGKDGFRIDHNQTVITGWGSELLRYRFFTDNSDSGKPIFGVCRSGGVRVIGLHFAKSDVMHGNVAFLAAPRTTQSLLAGEIPQTITAITSVDHGMVKMMKQLASKYDTLLTTTQSNSEGLNSLVETNTSSAAAAQAKREKNAERNAARRAKQKLSKQNATNDDSTPKAAALTSPPAKEASSAE